MKQKVKKNKDHPMTFTELDRCGTITEKIRKLRQDIAVILKNIESQINKKIPVEQIDKNLSEIFPKAKYLLREYEVALKKQEKMKRFEEKLSEVNTKNSRKRGNSPDTKLRMGMLKFIGGMSEPLMTRNLGKKI